MHAIEFQARVKNGTIAIPKEYKGRIKSRVRVILMVEEDTITNDYIGELLQNPIKVSSFQPLGRKQTHERN